MIHAVIMAGGAGTRFWPASRADRPKQLLNLSGDRSMIQATVDRLDGMVERENVLVVTNRRLVDGIREQLPQVPTAQIIGEPCKRDTAPCIGLAAEWITRSDPDAIMVVMPADHVIASTDAFQAALSHAAQLIADEPARIVTFGIRPTYPAETFGYIEREGESLPACQTPTFAVKQFREKPNATLAAEFLASGSFYWNSGIFVWKASTILGALKQHEPEMAARLNAIGESVGQSNFDEVFNREFAAIDGKSIDYAVMEHYSPVIVVEAPFDWDDVGNWPSIERLHSADSDGNTVIGRHLGIKTSGSIVRSEGNHLVVTLGMEDCIVVHTANATLVARKKDEESIRQVVAELEKREWREYL